MPGRIALLLLPLISLICLLPDVALAACTSPAGVKGEIIYNDDFDVLQFCDDTNWIGMSGGAGGGGGGSLTDGDVTVSGSGATWTVDSGSVTYAKMQNLSAAGILLGRATTGAGVVEEITLGSGLTLTGTTLSATGSSSGAAGYVQFSGGSGAFASSSTTAGQQFFWDETNHRLGIGIAVPTQAVDVVGKITSDSLLMKKVASIPAPTGGGSGGGAINLGTLQSASGTSMDYTIPAGAKRVTVMFGGVSLNTSSILVQLGTGGGIEATGYNGRGIYINGGGSGDHNLSIGVLFYGTGASPSSMSYSQVEFNLLGSNNWTFQGGLAGATADTRDSFVAGAKTLADMLTTVRITHTKWHR